MGSMKQSNKMEAIATFTIEALQRWGCKREEARNVGEAVLELLLTIRFLPVIKETFSVFEAFGRAISSIGKKS